MFRRGSTVSIDSNSSSVYTSLYSRYGGVGSSGIAGGPGQFYGTSVTSSNINRGDTDSVKSRGGIFNRSKVGLNQESTLSSGENIFQASRSGDISRVKFLLQKNNINNMDSNGWTVLMYAVCGSGSPELVRELLNRGANPNLKYGSREKTVLICAVEKGDADVVKVLLQERCDLEVKDADGWTALIHAVKLGNTDIARMVTLAHRGMTHTL